MNHFHHPIERVLHQQEFEIRAMIKSFYKGNSFSLAGTLQAQANQQTILPELERNCHRYWRTIDDSRKSAVCKIEQKRTLLWALGHVTSLFEEQLTSLQFVTYADPRDRVQKAALGTFSVKRYKRKITRLLSALASISDSLKVCGVVEISGSCDVDGLFRFEPHTHLIVAGATRNQIHAAFKPCCSGLAFAHPVKTLPIDTFADLGRRVSYMFKSTPELRQRFLGDDGRIRSQDNHLTGPELVEWLSLYSSSTFDELLITYGISKVFRQNFRSAEVAAIIQGLCRSSVKMPPRG